MPRAMSIHIGVNRPGGRNCTQEVLLRSEETAWRMAVLASQAGYESLQVLRGRAATRFAVHNALAGAAGTLQKGDNLLVTFSGHGGQIKDEPGDPEPSDESWSLYDGELVDDKLAGYWRLFEPGVRIVVVSESCFSGGLNRTWEECMAAASLVGNAQFGGPRPEEDRLRTPVDISGLDLGAPPPALDGFTWQADGADGEATRGWPEVEPQADTLRMPPGDADTGLDGVRDGGASLAAATASVPGATPAAPGGGAPQASCITEAPRDPLAIRASVLMLTASSEREKAGDGVFSCALLRAWRDGAFQGSYCELHAAVCQGVLAERPDQQPQILLMGAATPAFALERAFYVPCDCDLEDPYRTAPDVLDAQRGGI